MIGPFQPLFQSLLDGVPGLLGVVFADGEGEAVDQLGCVDQDLRIVAAHTGVLVAQVQRMLHLFHFGDAEEVTLDFRDLSLIVRVVGRGYYLVAVTEPSVHLAIAQRELTLAAKILARELE